MILVSFNLVIILVICTCDAANVTEDILKYFQSGNANIRNVWRKYKRGIETSLEQVLQENYHSESMNVYLKVPKDNLKLTEGFLEDSDPVVEVLFRDLYLLELPQMRFPKVSFPLASNVIKLDTELMPVRVIGKYMVYRNDSVIVYTNKKEEMQKVSPFSLAQVDPVGEVTIVGETCRLSGHAIASLTEQSVNLGHNTFSLSGCRFRLEISSPGQGKPPVLAPYFSSCDGGFLQNQISEALQHKLMSKLQGGIYSLVNTSEIFRSNFPRIRKYQEALFKSTKNYMTEAVNNMNTILTNQKQGVATLEPKVLEWTQTDEGGPVKYSVSITNTTLYGLDTAFASQTGGPEELNGNIYVEEVIGYSTIQVQGLIKYGMYKHLSSNVTPIAVRFSAEMEDFSVVISLTYNNLTKDLSAAAHPTKSRSAWYVPRYRIIDLNHYDIDSIWSRSLLIAYITNEIYTTVVSSILKGQLNEALKLTKQGSIGNIKLAEPEAGSDLEKQGANVDSQNSEAKEYDDGHEKSDDELEETKADVESDTKDKNDNEIHSE